MRRFPPRFAIEALGVLERAYRLAAEGQVSVDDFSRMQGMALQSLKDIAAIARSYPLTPDQEQAVQTAVSRIEGMTLPMVGSTGTPWWVYLLVGLLGAGIGAGAVALLAEPSHPGRPEMAGIRTTPSDTGIMAATMGVGSLIGLAGHAYRDTAAGALAVGAGSSVVGVSLTLLIKGLVGEAGGRAYAA
jgi:hypothetical protein